MTAAASAALAALLSLARAAAVVASALAASTGVTVGAREVALAAVAVAAAWATGIRLGGRKGPCGLGYGSFPFVRRGGPGTSRSTGRAKAASSISRDTRTSVPGRNEEPATDGGSDVPTVAGGCRADAEEGDVADGGTMRGTGARPGEVRENGVDPIRWNRRAAAAAIAVALPPPGIAKCSSDERAAEAETAASGAAVDAVAAALGAVSAADRRVDRGAAAPAASEGEGV